MKKMNILSISLLAAISVLGVSKAEEMVDLDLQSIYLIVDSSQLEQCAQSVRDLDEIKIQPKTAIEIVDLKYDEKLMSKCLDAADKLDSSLHLKPEETAGPGDGGNVGIGNSADNLKKYYITPEQFIPGNVYLPEYLSLEASDNKKARLFAKSLPELVELLKIN